MRGGKPVPATAKTSEEATLELDGRSVHLKRLNKALYAEAHFTKAQVIDYYVRVAPYLLPHFRDRPVTLKRYPDGVHAQAFYEKDAPSYRPKWVRTAPVPRRAGGPDINYIVIEDRATLAWIANIATLELHPFLHCAPDIQRPTSVVFDLDPGEGADIFNCIEIAFLIRKLFDKLGLQLFPKVSGSKGLQLYLPLNTPVTYAMTKPFAHAVAQLIESEHPDRAIAEMPKEKRAGKVFIDWSQNSDFKTTVGVYSMRAKQGRPYVSLPVTWEELERARKRKNAETLYFEAPDALARLEKIGDLFAPVLSVKQELPASIVPEPAVAKKRAVPKKNEPAPLPRRSSQGSRRRFVVQKHAASRLHYDFRLEIGGDLKSWAVPKGIPLEPGVRRLASATEDHPIAYVDFEGVIPQGQYGGGTVMVWDIGTFEIIEGNYWKGSLHFALTGRKLKGEWKLTRDAKKASNAWLLEKVGEPQPAVNDDASALSGRSMNQIADACDAVWQSNRAPRDWASEAGVDLASLPQAEARFIDPMQCKLVASLPEGDGWEYEVKFDGYRALIVRTNEVAIVSRRNNTLTGDFPDIAAACEKLPTLTVIDGEIVAIDENGKPSFNVLQNRRLLRDRARYFAFDLPVFEGRRLTGVPLEKRRALLKSVLQGIGSPVFYSDTLTATPAQIIQAARKAGFEGVIAKRRESFYEAGKRSGEWSKLKFYADQELVIGGYVPGPRGFDALLAGYYDLKKHLIFAGKIRNGFSAPGAKEQVFARFRGLGRKRCPFDNLPEPASARRGMALTEEAMRLCCWLDPQLVAQVGIREWTADAHMRHSTFLGLREDKDPRTVVRERPT